MSNPLAASAGAERVKKRRRERFIGEKERPDLTGADSNRKPSQNYTVAWGGAWHPANS
jgi:hypothetical protein